jgi:hypothetical protein
MKKKIGTSVLHGRPFGGTGFIFSKSLSLALKPCLEYQHERVSVLELSENNQRILIINLYLPYYDTNNFSEQIILYRETVGFIENIMTSNSDCKFILLLDMNCNIYDYKHPYTSILRSLMCDHGLISGFDLDPYFDPAQHYSRCDVKKASYTLIDGILISGSLSHLVESVKISHQGHNVSDHSPIELVLNIVIKPFVKKGVSVTEFIPWSDLSREHFLNFEKCMDKSLDDINVPYHSILHGNRVCTANDHIFQLERYCCDIIAAINCADSTLLRRKHGFGKSFWSHELTCLKNKSIVKMFYGRV